MTMANILIPHPRKARMKILAALLTAAQQRGSEPGPNVEREKEKEKKNIKNNYPPLAPWPPWHCPDYFILLPPGPRAGTVARHKGGREKERRRITRR